MVAFASALLRLGGQESSLPCFLKLIQKRTSIHTAKEEESIEIIRNIKVNTTFPEDEKISQPLPKESADTSANVPPPFPKNVIIYV